MKSAPEISEGHRLVVHRMRERALRGWYNGDEHTLKLFGAKQVLTAATNPELLVILLLSRDKMHHSVGWWRNAEYEYCWHLSISAWDRTKKEHEPEDIPPEEERYWSFAFFPKNTDKLWHEPGGTDPRLTPPEKMRHRHITHQRLFLDPETFEPFIPTGEVYDLTRWIDGLTPPKVDR